MDIFHLPKTMNLADPELELIDPTPNVHSMFLHFDRTFFWGKLSSRCVVRWSKRMYSCAGICSYEGRGGLCDIAISEPLLKLRPRKDMVETLLHEMIHAYLFVTNRDQDRDGHGPNFKAHMHRINRAAGLNISIYHSFHKEVQLYQTHWWRCNGPCQFYKPHFGIVRSTNNRAPGPSYYWWERHQRSCGGTFIKIKEPDKPNKDKKETNISNKGKKTNLAKPNADITKYINNNKEVSNKNIIQNNNTTKPVRNDSSNIPSNLKAGIKTNNSSTLVVTKKNVLFSPQVPKIKPVVFTGTGQTVGTIQPTHNERKRSRSNDVLETVRNIWANKKIDTNNKQVPKDNNSTMASNPIKHKPDFHTESPPPKVKKIDDYFKTAAISLLKDLYGQDIKITQPDNDQKLKAITTKSMKDESNFVDCPVCSNKIKSGEINRHLDECLNKDVIKMLTKESVHVAKNETSINELKTDNVAAAISNNLIKITPNDKIIDLVDIECIPDEKCNRSRKSLNEGDKEPCEQIINARDKKNVRFRKSDSYIAPSTSSNVQTTPIVANPLVKIEPSCSNSETKETACPCCGDKLNKTVDEHLDECLSFFENDTTVPDEGVIVIDDDFSDEFDESDKFNKTGTKHPCPCCLVMIEEIDMNPHLLECLDD